MCEIWTGACMYSVQWLVQCEQKGGVSEVWALPLNCNYRFIVSLLLLPLLSRNVQKGHSFDMKCTPHVQYTCTFLYNISVGVRLVIILMLALVSARYTCFLCTLLQTSLVRCSRSRVTVAVLLQPTTIASVYSSKSAQSQLAYSFCHVGCIMSNLWILLYKMQRSKDIPNVSVSCMCIIKSAANVKVRCLVLPCLVSVSLVDGMCFLPHLYWRECLNGLPSTPPCQLGQLEGRGTLDPY